MLDVSPIVSALNVRAANKTKWWWRRGGATAAAVTAALVLCAVPLDVSARRQGGAAGPVAERSSSPRPDDELDGLRARVAAEADDKQRARVRLRIAERLAETNHRTEALAELRALASEERFDPTGLYNIGNALARLGDPGAAAEAYRKAILQRHGNFARAQNNLGVVLIRLGQLDEAFVVLDAALRQESFSYAEASYNLGRLHQLRDEPEAAIKQWRRTLVVEPDHLAATIALARLYAKNGDSKRAVELLDAFSARLSSRGAGEPRDLAIARGEIIAAGNVAAEAGRNRPATAAASADSAPRSSN